MAQVSYFFAEKTEKGVRKLNKKNAIVSIVLIALMCGFLIPTSVKGWQTGPGSAWNNTTFAEYGPRADTLWYINYGSYTGEYNALAAKSADWIDRTLDPADYVTLSGLGGFTFGNNTNLGIDMVEFNTYFLPCNYTEFRVAISDMLATHREGFVNSLLGAGGLVAYSPIPGCIADNSGYPFYDPTECFALYDPTVYGYSDALSRLCALATANPTVFPLAPDQCPGAPANTATWNFTVPFEIKDGVSYNPNCDGLPNLYDGGILDGKDPSLALGTGANWGLSIKTRTNDNRKYIGPEVQQMLGDNFTWWYNNKASLADKNTWYAALDVFGLAHTYTPYISVQVNNIPSHDAWIGVFSEYIFELYTAGYSYGFTPNSMMASYLTSHSPQSNGWGTGWDDTLYSSATFDAEEAAMEQSTPTQAPPNAVDYAHQAQVTLMSDAAVFPYWTDAGYTPCLTSTYRNINQPGSGFNNWWSWLNAYPTAGSPGAATNTIYAGLRGATQGMNNPISSNSYYDWQMIPEIYDSLCVLNPYNLSQVLPYIATYSVGSWSNPNKGGESDTMFTFHMRNDVWWQDVPGIDPSNPLQRCIYTTDNGTALDGSLTNRLMTPLDVAFSFEYQDIGYAYTTVQTGGGFMQLDHINISSIYEPQWTSQLTPGVGFPWMNESYIINDVYGSDLVMFPLYQGWTVGLTPYYSISQAVENTVRFDNSDSYTVKVYMSVQSPYFGLYNIATSPIFPMDIFSHLAMGGGWYTINAQANRWLVPGVGGTDLEPTDYGGIDLEYGSGPYVYVNLAGDGPNNYAFKAYKAGLTYGPAGASVTTIHSYFWNCPVRETDQKFYYKAGDKTAWIYFEFTNFDAFNSMTFAFTPTLSVWWYVSGSWVFGGLGSVNQAGWPVPLTLAAGATQGWWFRFGPLSIPGGATWMKPDKEYTIEITAGPSYAVGAMGAGAGMFTNQDSRYANGICMINLARLSGDISGSTPTSAYYGSDGSVGPADLGVISPFYKAAVSWVFGINPTDNLHKAAITGGATVGPADLGKISAQWKTSWDTTVGGKFTHQPPPDP